uniref:Uncharacterized protein n=1 Tax=Arundo donax TaxID=35708 RepID=A0A0A9ACE1_ARUDO
MSSVIYIVVCLDQFAGNAYLRSSCMRISTTALSVALIWTVIHWRSSDLIIT